MRKAYLLVYSSTLGTYDEVKACLNQIPEVLTWRKDLPSSFYLISETDATTLARLIRECRGKKGRFLVTELVDNSNGWLPNASWYLMQNKRLKPKEQSDIE